MNETHEKRTTQPFGTFFNLIYTVALLISRLLHPVSVKGLENLPRNGALLIGQLAQVLSGKKSQSLIHLKSTNRSTYQPDQ